jgi:two-component system, NarL family, sensor histidine kinase UhpB
VKTPLKILMLEDNATDAEIVQRLLKKEKRKIEFSLATNKEEYLLALDQFHPDLILSDNTLPQFNGTEALEIIRQRSLYIPFILITGTVSEEFAAGIIKLGADDYILKDRLIRLPGAIEAALQKKGSEAAIRHSEEIRKLIMNSALDAIICINITGEITVWNPQAEKMFGWKENEIIGKKLIETIIPEQNRKSHSDGFSRYMETGEGAILNKVIEIAALNRAGNEFPVELAIVPIKQNGDYFFCAFIRDITERKKTEEALQVMEQEILNQKVQEQKKITRAIIKAQESERNHIGLELHDNVNQILAGTKLYLSMAGKGNEKVKKLIRYPIELIDSSIKEIRLLSSKQVTPLKDINLKELIHSLLDDLTKNTIIKTTFIYNVINEAIDDDLKLNIYRIIQEQVNNIIKHAASKNVNVSVQASSKAINIIVTDDGKGFNAGKKRKGIGISNMINRIESFNGEVAIKSSPGKGCAVQIKIPY